jgi:hypothetical protein
MKNFLSAVSEYTRPLSQKWLFLSFISGYVLAIIFYSFFGPQVHHFLDYLIQSI